MRCIQHSMERVDPDSRKKRRRRPLITKYARGQTTIET